MLGCYDNSVWSLFDYSVQGFKNCDYFLGYSSETLIVDYYVLVDVVDEFLVLVIVV